MAQAPRTRDRFELEHVARMQRALTTENLDDAIRQLRSMESAVRARYRLKRLAQWKHRALLLYIHTVVISRLADTNRTNELRQRWKTVCDLCSRLDAGGVSPMSLTTCAVAVCDHLRRIGRTDDAVDILRDLEQRMSEAQHVGYKSCRNELRQLRRHLTSNSK
jgi:hypothetical protein